jgi:hypothetical protein
MLAVANCHQLWIAGCFCKSQLLSPVRQVGLKPTLTAVVAGPSPPSPHDDPSSSCTKQTPKWLQAALCAAAYFAGLATLAGYRAAGSFVGGKIARLRQQHMGPGARPSHGQHDAVGGASGSYQVSVCVNSSLHLHMRLALQHSVNGVEHMHVAQLCAPCMH